VSQRLREQSEALRSADEAVRAGHPKGVHDLRVAMRRIRSVLATFRPLLDTTVTEPLRDELRWAARRLGEARDAQVVQELVDTLLDHLGATGDSGVTGLDDASAGLRARLHLDACAAEDVITETMASSRYAAALDLLVSVAENPPFADVEGPSAKRAVRKALRKEAKRLRAKIAVADEVLAAEGSVRRASCLHDVRKAAKRLRYAAETARPVAGGSVRRDARRARVVQSVLGDHHDVVVTRESLRRLALDEEASIAAAFLVGHLDADEERAAARLERRSAHALERLDRAVADALS
jgi:CHAD domain-containing protein